MSFIYSRDHFSDLIAAECIATCCNQNCVSGEDCRLAAKQLGHSPKSTPSHVLPFLPIPL